MNLTCSNSDAAAPSTPRAEYERRLEASRKATQLWQRRESLLGNARVAVFLVGLLIVYSVFVARKLAWPVLFAPATVFVLLVQRHESATRNLRRGQRTSTYYERGLARLDERWTGTGDAGERYLVADHPYVADLDIFGPGSLFERISTARTRSGADTLARWLGEPASRETIVERQQSVADLRERINLREHLALLGADLPAGIDLNALVQWGSRSRLLVGGAARTIAAVLVSITLLSLVGCLNGDLPAMALLAAVGAEGAFGWRYKKRVDEVIAPIDRTTHDLALFAGLLARIEREAFAAPRLQLVQQSLLSAGERPSQRIARLLRLVNCLDCKHNQYFALVAPFLLWTTQLAFAFEAWRAASGPAIARWLEAVAEFEALCSLAAYSFENPADPFPDIGHNGPCYDGNGLGHPLLPAARCIRNDVCLTAALRVLVVSGSNMSGKSTLLRTVGINAVLALAGGPVRAARLRLTPLAIGATLRIQDSLQAGRSRFYAEIQRVRQMVDLAKGPLPLLFLLDEIFHGTNSHDRRQGAQAVVRSLVDLGAIGLVTTHDLALTHIADELAPRAANVHFEDHFDNGAIHFDYQMRPGVVQKSNALELMRAVGLDV